MQNKILQLIEDSQKKKDIPNIQVGDTLDIHQRILEGQKERLQVFNGVVIAMKGRSLTATITVRRIVQGEGVERVFLVHSPKIAKIDIKRTGKVRRAKLYYLRKRVGKATRLKERDKVQAPSANSTPKPASKSEAPATTA
jgi:large subunit ribosomal protein L19